MVIIEEACPSLIAIEPQLSASNATYTTPASWSDDDDLELGDQQQQQQQHETSLLISSSSSSSSSLATAVASQQNEFTFRSIQVHDRQQIQRLHEEWFPVRYQQDFYDELVHGRMAVSGESLYTQVATSTNDTNNSIAACVVAAFVDRDRLSSSIQDILISDRKRYNKLFYIMTLGTAHEYRGAGLATALVERCVKHAEQDPACGVLYLHVITFNQPAIQFYEKLNFYRIKEIPNYYNIDGKRYNCYLYAKYLNGNTGHTDIFRLISNIASILWRQIKLPFTLLLNSEERHRRNLHFGLQ